MEATRAAGDHDAIEALRHRYDRWREDHPKAWLRDAAGDLGVSEAELLVATGDVTPLRTDDLPGLLGAIAAWGELRTMTRNDDAVIEHTGRYDNLEFFGPAMGQTVGSIDLRIFATRWAHAYAVRAQGPKGPRRSVQFFDRHGVNVHKVFARDPGAFQAVVDAWRAPEGTPALPAIDPLETTPERPDGDVDVAALHARWDALDDTHAFHGMLRDLDLTRTQALRLAGPERAVPVHPEALARALEGAAERSETTMIFVGNRGLVQIFIGTIGRVAATPGWLNVLDRDFNLHVREGGVTRAWIVTKPTRHGPVRSLECYDDAGNTVVQLFGKRTEQESTPAGWGAILNALIETHRT